MPDLSWETLLPELGTKALTGGQGIVFRGIWKKKQERDVEVAVKFFKNQGGGSATSLACLENEATVMQLAGDSRSEYIVGLFGIARGKPTPAWLERLQGCDVLMPQSVGGGGDAQPELVGIVSKWQRGGSLHGLLYSRGWGATCAVRLRLCANVADGLAALHSHHVVHGDIKPQNVLMSGCGPRARPRLTDFGLSSVFEAQQDSTLSALVSSHEKPGGTWAYKAPEMMLSGKDGTPPAKATRGSDVYALATLAVEVLSSTPPWNGHTEQSRLSAALEERDSAACAGAPAVTLLSLPGLGLKFPLDLPLSCKTLLAACLSPERSKRPSAIDFSQEFRRAANDLESGGFDIFLSHAWEGEDHAPLTKAVLSRLNQSSLRLWVDKSNLEHDMKESISHGLNGSSCVLALISRRYAESSMCLFELREAKRLGKRIVACLSDPDPTWFPTGEVLALVERHKLYADLRRAAAIDWRQPEKELLCAVEEHLTTPPAAFPKLLQLLDEVLERKEKYDDDDYDDRLEAIPPSLWTTAALPHPHFLSPSAHDGSCCRCGKTPGLFMGCCSCNYYECLVCYAPEGPVLFFHSPNGIFWKYPAARPLQCKWDTHLPAEKFCCNSRLLSGPDDEDTYKYECLGHYSKKDFAAAGAEWEAADYTHGGGGKEEVPSFSKCHVSSVPLAPISRGPVALSNCGTPLESWQELTPLYHWDFSRDLGPGALMGRGGNRAVSSNGRLILSGEGGPFFLSPPLPVDVTEKTLEVIVRLSSPDQRSGAAISIFSGGVFDAIVFAEREEGKWMLGSDFFQRTADLEVEDWQKEVGGVQHLVAVYSADNSVALFKNGLPFGASYTPGVGLQTFPAGSTFIAIGNRLPFEVQDSLQGEVSFAALYDRALSAKDVADAYQRALYIIASPGADDHLLFSHECGEDGFGALRAKHSSKILSVDSWSGEDGATLHQYDDEGPGDNQLFALEPASGGWGMLRAKHSGKVVDQGGQKVHQWEAHGGDNQLFRFEPVDEKWSRLRIKGCEWGPGKLLQVTGSSLANGARYSLGPNAEDHMLFCFDPDEDGWGRLCVKHSEQFVSVCDDGNLNGTILHQWPGDADCQRFKRESVGDGPWCMLRAKHSGKVIDQGDQKVHQWEEYGGDNQLFLFEPVDEKWSKLRIKDCEWGPRRVLMIQGASLNEGARLHIGLE